MSKFVNTSTF